MRNWSPVSYAGKVYEFDRGLFCISRNRTRKYDLDSGSLHHGDATIIATFEVLGQSIPNTRRAHDAVHSYAEKPFEAGVLASKAGVTTVQ